MTPEIQALVDSIINNVKGVDVPFTQLMPWESYFNQALARQGATQRAQKYYNPIREKGLQDIAAQAAQRGLFRSGMRQRQQGEYRTDIADQLQQMVEQLYNIREEEAGGRYALEQQRFEQDPVGYARKLAADNAAKQNWNNMRSLLQTSPRDLMAARETVRSQIPALMRPQAPTPMESMYKNQGGVSTRDNRLGTQRGLPNPAQSWLDRMRGGATRSLY